MEAGLAQIEVIDERVDEPNRTIRRHIVLYRCRQQQRLVARITLDVRHDHSIRRSAILWNRSASFRTAWIEFRQWPGSEG